MGTVMEARESTSEEPLLSSPRVLVVTGGIFSEHLVLWERCAASGANVTIVGTDTNIYEGRWPWTPSLSEDLGSVVLSPVSPAVQKGHLWWTYRGFKDAVRRLQPDIIHVLSEPWGALVAQSLVASRSSGVHAKVCAHGADNIYWHGGAIERAARRSILRAVLPRLDGFVSWNEEGVAVARDAGLGDVPTAVIPAILPDPSDFSGDGASAPTRAALGLPPDDPVLGYVGRLSRDKGVLDLMYALKRLGDRAPYLAVWGSGDLEGTIEASFSSGELRGRYGGALPLDGVGSALSSCDIIAVPSKVTSDWKEQFGRVVLEAMFAGRAIVATSTGAIPEVLGDAGILVGDGDIAALADAIGSLEDAPKRRRLGASARDRAVTHFDPAHLADDMVAFWREVAR